MGFLRAVSNDRLMLSLPVVASVGRASVPSSIRCFPAYLRDAGYYCTNNVKTDYNFPVPKDAWDENSRKAHWRNRGKGQPFFAVFNYTGSHESRIWEKNHAQQVVHLKPNERHDPAKAPIPPFHPDTPVVRRDWANYHDNVTSLFATAWQNAMT
jgi:uncharacterized sulfatase